MTGRRAERSVPPGTFHEKGKDPSAVSARRHSQGDVVWTDGCFRIEADAAGTLWVTELLHVARGDVAKTWRLRFSDVESARRMIAVRLRQGHNKLYHSRREAVAG